MQERENKRKQQRQIEISKDHKLNEIGFEIDRVWFGGTELEVEEFQIS